MNPKRRSAIFARTGIFISSSDFKRSIPSPERAVKTTMVILLILLIASVSSCGPSTTIDRAMEDAIAGDIYHRLELIEHDLDSHFSQRHIPKPRTLNQAVGQFRIDPAYVGDAQREFISEILRQMPDELAGFLFEHLAGVFFYHRSRDWESAMANWFVDEDRNIFGVIGINVEALDFMMNDEEALEYILGPGLSWEVGYSVTQDFSVPGDSILARSASARAVYQLLIHEIGHMVDFVGNFSGFLNDRALYPPEYRVRQRYFAENVWTSDGQPIIDEAFRFNTGFDTSSTDSVEIQLVSPHELLEHYALDSSFVSHYATTNPMEDFAEYFRIYILEEVLGYQLETRVIHEETDSVYWYGGPDIGDDERKVWFHEQVMSFLADSSR
jgi:hypothetical protein